MTIGYACLTIGVPNTGLSRCILKNATKEKLREITVKNLSALDSMIEYNIRNGIRLFRISSDIIPFGSHPINQVPWWNDYKDLLLQLGRKISEAQIRVSMHPGQYTVLNATNPQVVQSAVRDLIYHNRFLDALGMDEKSKLVLHIGGIYGDKEKAIEVFISNYSKLPQGVKDRLILENDDKNYTIKEVLDISQVTGAPVVFDNLHHYLNPPMEEQTQSYWITKARETWREKDGKQKIHYSQQKTGGTPGSHSDTIYLDQFLEFYQSLPEPDIDIMLEVKDKNLSAVKCIHTAELNSTAEELKEEWARYQYFVLSRSTKLYNDIQDLLENKDARIANEFYYKLEQTYLLSEDKAAEVYAAQQVWNTMSNDSTNAEKKRYEKLLSAYKTGNGDIKPLKNHLLKCAQDRREELLLQSLYFYI